MRAFRHVAPFSTVHASSTDATAEDAATHPRGPQALDALRDACVNTVLT
ncbi:hypothetical protein SMC26_08230 [Actinomadura fulvescens]|uniref:Uncharacterized protein n=1 Tax=Actinomadura fulvescens TaxID=46160 RepID=A0ABN3QWQ7_9ACTN